MGNFGSPKFMTHRPTVVSLDPVQRGDWIFQTSQCPATGAICVVTINPIMLWTNVRYFLCDSAAEHFMDYLVSQTNLE